jgi:hypothetical protein
LFNFDIRHISDIKHTATNGLSCRPKIKSDNNDEKNEVDIDDFIDTELAFISIRFIKTRVISKLNDSYFLRL